MHAVCIYALRDAVSRKSKDRGKYPNWLDAYIIVNRGFAIKWGEGGDL